MKIDHTNVPKSSFLAMEKDCEIIVNKILQNKRLQRLLYYTVPDALYRPNLTEEQATELLGNQVKLVPKFYVDGTNLVYMLIRFDNFAESLNPEFRENLIEFDIVCHFDQWQLKDYEMRPYKIAAEIDTMIDNQRLTGIGLIEFVNCRQVLLTDEYAGLVLKYRIYHGEEDKKHMLTPRAEEKFLEDFQEMIEAQNE